MCGKTRQLMWVGLAVLCLAGLVQAQAYYTDFTEPDLLDWAALSGDWVHDPVAGTYSVQSTETVISLYNGSNAYALEDYTVTVEVANGSNNVPLAVRATNGSTYYLCRIQNSGNIEFIPIKGGSIGTRQNKSGGRGLVYPATVVITAAGDTITIKAINADGAEVGPVEFVDEEDPLLVGTAGFRNWGNEMTVSSFRIDLPDRALSPDPANGAVDVSLDTALTWNTGPNPGITHHYVYLSTDLDVLLNDWDSVRVAEMAATEATGSYTPDNLVNSVTYYWAVDEGVNNGGPNDEATIFGKIWSFTTRSGLPLFVQQPGSAIVDADQTVVLSLTVDSPTEAHYAWYRGDVGDISVPVGTDSAALTIETVQAGDEGLYWCRVSNAIGSVDSDAVGLYLKALLAHWNLGEVDTTAGEHVDIAGGNNAVIRGTATFVEGKDGDPNGAVQVSPGNGMGVAPAISPTTMGGQMTLSMWVNWDGPNGGHQRPLAKRDVAFPSSRWYVALLPDANEVRFDTYNSGSASGFSLTPDGAWQLICVTLNGNQVTYYVTDKQSFSAANMASAELTLAADTLDSPISIGAGNKNGSYSFNGAIDDVRIYNYAMTMEDVAELWYETSQQGICLNPPVGDLNGDCRVDSADADILQAQMGQCGLIPAEHCGD